MGNRRSRNRKSKSRTSRDETAKSGKSRSRKSSSNRRKSKARARTGSRRRKKGLINYLLASFIFVLYAFQVLLLVSKLFGFNFSIFFFNLIIFRDKQCNLELTTIIQIQTGRFAKNSPCTNLFKIQILTPPKSFYLCHTLLQIYRLIKT